MDDGIFYRYRDDLVKLRMLTAEIQAIERFLEESADERIFGEAVKHERDVPVQENKTADRTQTMALRTDKTKEQYIYMLNIKRHEALELNLRVNAVKIALESLKENARWVIEQYYIEGKTAVKILKEYAKKFDFYISERSLRNIRAEAAATVLALLPADIRQNI